MKDQQLEYFNKWEFLPINNEFIVDWLDALSWIAAVQEKYHKKDINKEENL